MATYTAIAILLVGILCFFGALGFLLDKKHTHIRFLFLFMGLGLVLVMTNIGVLMLNSDVAGIQSNLETVWKVLVPVIVFTLGYFIIYFIMQVFEVWTSNIRLKK